MVSIVLCAVLFGAAEAQASSGPVSNPVTASVRPIQPAISGLFQVHTPRVWADAFDEAGLLGANGVPDFLEAWPAFSSRQDSAILKTGYAFRTIDDQGNQILYAGVKRASSGGPSKVVFQFNQKPGQRLVGDLLISAEIDSDGNVGTARFESSSLASKGSRKVLELAILSGEGCSEAGSACIVANGALLEVGVNLSHLLGALDGFKEVQITTPEDSVVGLFSLTPVVGGAGSCVKEVGALSKAGCTANDIQFTAIVPGTLAISNNNCAIDGQGNLTGTVTFSATGRFVLTTQTRYDVGLYIDTNGDPENDTARTGECTRFAFSNAEAVNAETPADSCGDLTAAIAAAPLGRALPFGPVTIDCVDKDDDGKVDVFHCETWSQNEDEINCTGSGSVKAGTSSKCNCGLLAGACIPTPSDDECTENVCALRCSNSPATACTIGGNQCTAPGFCTDTLVTQNKANGSACGDDTTSGCHVPDSCQAGECVSGIAPATTICRAQNGVCDVADSCDGVSGDCPTDSFAASTTECRASAGICDMAESCTGSSPNCPVDGFQPATTECRPSDGSPCDPAESCSGSSATCGPDLCVGGVSHP